MSVDLSSSSTESYDGAVTAPAPPDLNTSASVRTPLQNLTNRVRFVWARLQELVGAFLPLTSLFPVPLSCSGSTFTVAGHGLAASDPVRIWSVGGSVPSPLAQFTTYYAVGATLTSNTFQVSATPGGSAITLTNGGSGTLYGAKQTSSTLGQSISTALANLLGTANTWTAQQTYQQVPALSGVASITRHQDLRVGNVKNIATGFSGTGLPSAYLEDSNIVMSINWGPMIVTRSTGTGPADYFDIPIDVPDAATLNSVTITDQGGAGPASPTNPPTYEIIACSGAGIISALSSVTSDSHTFGTNWLTTLVDTVVTATGGGQTVNRTTNSYFLRVNSAYDSVTGGCVMWIPKVRYTYTPATVQV